MNGIQVKRQTQGTRVGPNGQSIEEYRVEFMVGDHGPFYETFTKDQYTADQVNARLQAVARTVNMIGA